MVPAITQLAIHETRELAHCVAIAEPAMDTGKDVDQRTETISNTARRTEVDGEDERGNRTNGTSLWFVAVIDARSCWWCPSRGGRRGIR